MKRGPGLYAPDDVPVAPAPRFAASWRLQEKAHRLIPGGCHTYAKGDDQYPLLAPGFIRAGKGCHVWDVDGNEFIEYGMGCRAVTLGHGYGPVVAAAADAMAAGTNFTRPAAIEVACAEEFLRHVDGAEMVKFAKDGSTVTTAAVRLARAATGRTLVAVCDGDPFISYNDWFIGLTPMRAGIPAAVRQSVVSFRYNDAVGLHRFFNEHAGAIACVICELERTEPPRAGFLADLRRLCTAHGTLLIADEMITGFRWPDGNAQKHHGITADLATFGKAMGNGFAVSALAGRADLMERGGIRHDKERVFLLSTTHGAETHALAAARKTMQIYRSEDVVGHLDRMGRRLQEGMRAAARARGVAAHVDAVGMPCNLVYVTRDESGKPSQAFRALFMQELIRHGVLAPSFVVSYAHHEDDIERTIEAVDAALVVYRRALDAGVEQFLCGPPVKPVFRAYC